ncbi:hypothetical protein LIPSTDRAFT_309699 [Lipomyces starkeyi NRRL Y-11557]|uniref:Uncharacterized protein n=1 Tax=Lipomyces starkeyi NRRL Y-11557 TaxID=675824 RepID=A0A1E3Q2D4_LIPST|nr:hypothetical protein LIPSTDRAFT_309699 [Lipomyces starkeyi NRRL Y-11557]
MDPIPTGLAAVAVNNPHTLYVGMVFESVGQARQFVNAHCCSCASAPKSHSTPETFQLPRELRVPTASRVIETLGACFVTVLGKFASKSSSMTHGSLRSSLKNIVDTSSKV